HSSLGGNYLLGAEGNFDRLFSRQRECLVARVGMERLAAAKHRCKGFGRYPDDVVVHLLRSQRLAGRLDVEAEMHRLCVFGSEALLHYLGIDAPCSPELGDLFKELHCTAEKERKTWGKIVYLHSSGGASLDVFNSICK